ncbi:MAG: ribonuclease III [Patescibacteria group bacterium]|nr:ribonuclease III [Patescibacteria group bacterium]
MNLLTELEKRIGTDFKNNDLLQEALTHRSYLNENPRYKYGNNERLEFLGDAVLELIVTEELFNRLPEKEEGEMTSYRAALVNAKMLARVADDIGLAEKILVSKGEARELDKTKSRESISADAVEAVIGAIYLDAGFDAAKEFIAKFIFPNIDEILRSGGKDAKSRVQEIAQEKLKITPTYKVISESGPAHDRIFKVGLYFGDRLESEGEGKSKQEAETNAAEEALQKLGAD